MEPVRLSEALLGQVGSAAQQTGAASGQRWCVQAQPPSSTPFAFQSESPRPWDLEREAAPVTRGQPETGFNALDLTGHLHHGFLVPALAGFQQKTGGHKATQLQIKELPCPPCADAAAPGPCLKQQLFERQILPVSRTCYGSLCPPLLPTLAERPQALC